MPQNSMHKPRMLTLFLSVLKISAFTFGGGYVIVPLMRKRFAEELGWIEQDEMLDLIAIAQSAPGPIAVNTSILLGYRLLGIRGALVAALGTSLPPLVVLSLISIFYEAFRQNTWIAALMSAMRAGVTAVIFDVVWTMAGAVFKKRQPTPIFLMVAAFVAVYFFRVNILLVLLLCAILGFVTAMYQTKTGKKEGRA